MRMRMIVSTRRRNSHDVLLSLLLVLIFIFQANASSRRWTIAAASLPRVHSDTRRRRSSTALAPPRGGESTPKTKTAAWLDGVKSGMSSAMAAGCVKTVLQPIDAIKTVQQYYKSSAAGESLSILEACADLLQRPGGFWNFYAGLGVTVFGAMPGVALYFGVYSFVKKTLLATDYGQQHKTLAVGASAAIGNTVASFSRVPYEVLKQKLQAGTYSSTWEAFRAVWTSEAWWTLLFPKGGVATQMLRDIPYAIVTLILYESLQSHFSKQKSSKTSDFLLGGIAGGIGSWVTNPMDVIKTRLQTESAVYGGSVWKCADAIWQEGGAAAFLRGSVPRLMHKIPANAFFFLFYEFFKRLLRVEESVVKQEQSTAQRK